MLFDDIFGDEQAEAGAASLMRPRPVAGKKHLKQMRQLVRRNGVPVIDDADDRIPFFHPAVDIDVPAVFAVTDGVGQQILEHAGQQVPVAGDRQLRGEVEADGQARFFRTGGTVLQPIGSAVRRGQSAPGSA